MTMRVTPFNLNKLAQSISSRKGVGPATASALARRGLTTLGDALFFLPRAYQDRRRITPLNEIAPGAHVVVRGEVISTGRFGRGGKGYRMVIDQSGASIACLWFRYKRAHLEEYAKGSEVLAVGDVSTSPRGEHQMVHPQIFAPDALEEGNPSLGRLVPVYPEIEGVSPGRIKGVMSGLVDELAPLITDPLFGLAPVDLYPMPVSEALARAHNPAADAPAEDLDPGSAPWLRSLAVNELIYYEVGLALKRQGREAAAAVPVTGPGLLVSRLLELLPFRLTQGQIEAVEAIRSDLAGSGPMGRLLMGDVSTGKTLVALAAALMTAEAGAQTALMAPTEILARQHFEGLGRHLGELGLEAVLCVGSLEPAARKRALKRVAGGAPVVIGTHALFSEDVEFKKLGLAVIDEQHRFGVHQRLRLAAKGAHPHLLVLSATPIPRTLALALAGHLEVSDLSQRVGGTPKVATRVIEHQSRKEAVDAVAAALAAGDQVYVICPLVEASEIVDAQDAVQTHRRLSQFFPDAGVGLLHGRMSGEEQQQALDDFTSGKNPLLVATTVVEVGVDVPRATLMVVLGAERFGLSQLHQLRGRVGRGERPGTCLLVAGETPGEEGLARLEVLAKTNDGREVAEADLMLRGPGEALGRRQSGLPAFRVANWLRDSHLVPRIREVIAEWLVADPELASPELALIKEETLRRWSKNLGLNGVEP